MKSTSSQERKRAGWAVAAVDEWNRIHAELRRLRRRAARLRRTLRLLMAPRLPEQMTAIHTAMRTTILARPEEGGMRS